MRFNAITLKTWINIGTAVILLSALLLSMLMTSDALQSSTRFDRLYTLLLVGNIIAIVALIALTLLNVGQLIRQVRKQRTGARLTVRLFILLVFLSVTPVSIVYYFALQFINQRLDSWFNVSIEQALSNSLNLSQAAIDARRREALRQTEAIAEALSLSDETQAIPLALDELRARSGASEIMLLTTNGRLIASNVADTGQLLPTQQPNDSLLLYLKQAQSYIGLEPTSSQGWTIRVIVKIMQGNEVLLLQTLFPVAQNIKELASTVQATYADYQERAYLHDPLKISFTLVLSLLLLITIFGAIWVSYFIARRFVTPLIDLAEGTQAVARGNYDKQLPVNQLNELGFLVQSFNDMTRRIALAQEAVKRSQETTDVQKIYLETVLGRLSSGVISLDNQLHLRTTNAAAEHILGIPLTELLGQSLWELQEANPPLQAIYILVQKYQNDKDVSDWREEMTFFGTGGRKILMCRGTRLKPAYENLPLEGGYVLLFDDITNLLQAQREAAWSEVARRLAHEIKNPLTPIQLSAERLRQKYLREDKPDKQLETLDRMTHTIIQQVEAMKEMVNAFSDYARTPQMKWQRINLNNLIQEVLDLYQSEKIHLTFLLDEDLPIIEADRGRLRQVLHNLIKNAIEASPVDAQVLVQTRYLSDPQLNCVELRIQDEGPGVPAQLLDQIFEPYVSTKPKGTGLGLAIVKKIIDEHNGMVWIENTQGACVIIRLPIINLSRSETTATSHVESL
ncbi:signal transduction histidine kinase involved in nitrogen fixation and metabolism regulation [Beggiatoa alba B18LD]|uniref:histidine kinase n=1 Tax=Beggiatoa alba B18LD TaxID=395493 RepID=I3CDF8_9GAMM|nr:ATP-binding protein [Beggiatoa alba]EIJ41651.1 signal transduction histidine kinase involved in nitrogen fixation and metabolism regulation [Beggiatoa alba B18LD]